MLDFDYVGLARFLTKGQKLIDKNYYIGVVRAKPSDKKGQALRSNQQKLFAVLSKGNWQIYRGFLLMSGGKFHEKGVDVKIAMDMLVGAYEDQFDAVCLVSSDTDLLPVIDKIQSMGKKVEYVGFSNRPSLALIKHSSSSRLLKLEDIKVFAKK